MTDDPRIGEIPIPKEDHPLFRWFCPKPTVRILFYTDDFSVLLNNVSSFGVGILRDLIVNHNTFYANFDIHLLNRHDPSHAANKLTPALLSSYDQVWFSVSARPICRLRAAYRPSQRTSSPVPR